MPSHRLFPLGPERSLRESTRETSSFTACVYLWVSRHSDLIYIMCREKGSKQPISKGLQKTDFHHKILILSYTTLSKLYIFTLAQTFLTFGACVKEGQSWGRPQVNGPKRGPGGEGQLSSDQTPTKTLTYTYTRHHNDFICAKLLFNSFWRIMRKGGPTKGQILLHMHVFPVSIRFTAPGFWIKFGI